MEENNLEVKSNKTKTICIILVVLLIIAGVAFGLVKYVFNGEENNKEEEKTSKTIDEENVESYPYYLVVTAKYGGTEQYKEFIISKFGDNAEERFRNYFQWYNVVHELSHGLITYNSNMNVLVRMALNQQDPQLEEIKVNNFAVAYWKKYGDPERIKLLKETVDYLLSNMKDPTDGKMTFEEYGKQIMTSDSEPTFEEYGWFQFSCVKHALDSDLTLEEAYKGLGLVKEVTFDDEVLNYTTINEEESDKVINDTVNKFKKWGLNYPSIYHKFDNDPNNNYSRPLNLIDYNNLKSQEQ